MSNIKTTDPDQILTFMYSTEYEDHRCIYENEEILVEHSVMDFPDGSREAVMSVHSIQDGMIIRTETGATLIK